jgi:hypothetical protein
MSRVEMDPIERRALVLCRMLPDGQNEQSEALKILSEINHALRGERNPRSSVSDLQAVVELAVSKGWLVSLDGRLSVTPSGRNRATRSRAGLGKRGRTL